MKPVSLYLVGVKFPDGKILLTSPEETRAEAMEAAKRACANYPDGDVYVCSVSAEYQARIGDVDFKPV